jgi:hypothetical protein
MKRTFPMPLRRSAYVTKLFASVASVSIATRTRSSSRHCARMYNGSLSSSTTAAPPRRTFATSTMRERGVGDGVQACRIFHRWYYR